MSKQVIDVGGMSCTHCVKAVTEAISAIDGVSKVKVVLKKNNATVKFDESKTNLDAIKAAVAEVGFEV